MEDGHYFFCNPVWHKEALVLAVLRKEIGYIEDLVMLSITLLVRRTIERRITRLKDHMRPFKIDNNRYFFPRTGTYDTYLMRRHKRQWLAIRYHGKELHIHRSIDGMYHRFITLARKEKLKLHSHEPYLMGFFLITMLLSTITHTDALPLVIESFVQVIRFTPIALYNILWSIGVVLHYAWKFLFAT